MAPRHCTGRSTTCSPRRWRSCWSAALTPMPRSWCRQPPPLTTAHDPSPVPTAYCEPPLTSGHGPSPRPHMAPHQCPTSAHGPSPKELVSPTASRPSPRPHGPSPVPLAPHPTPLYCLTSAPLTHTPTRPHCTLCPSPRPRPDPIVSCILSCQTGGFYPLHAAAFHKEDCIGCARLLLAAGARLDVHWVREG